MPKPYRVPVGRPEVCHWCRSEDGTHTEGCAGERRGAMARVAEARAVLHRSRGRTGPPPPGPADEAVDARTLPASRFYVGPGDAR